MDRPVIRKTIREYYMWKSFDWFQEQGFDDNPLKAYLYAIFILMIFWKDYTYTSQ